MYKIHINNEFKKQKIPIDDFPDLNIIYISSEIHLCPNKFGKDVICVWEGDISITLNVNGELITLKSSDAKNKKIHKVNGYELQGIGYSVKNHSRQETYLHFSITRTEYEELSSCLECDELNSNFVRFDGKQFMCELCCMDLDKKGGSGVHRGPHGGRGGSGIRGGMRRGGSGIPGVRRGGRLPGRTTRIGVRGTNWRRQGTMGYYNRYRYHTGFSLRYPWFNAYASFPYYHPFWWLLAQYPVGNPFWDTFQYYPENDKYWETL
jgi:hypothetical protein